MSHSELHPEEWQRYQGDPMEDGLLFVIRLGPDLEAIAPPESPPIGPPKKRRVPWFVQIALIGTALAVTLAFLGFREHYPWTSEDGAPKPREKPLKKEERDRILEELKKESQAELKVLRRDLILDQLKWGKFGMAEAELRKALRSFPGDKELEELLEGLHREFSLKRLKFRYQKETEEKEILVPARASKFDLTSEKGIALVSEDNFCIELVPLEDGYLYIYQIDSHGQFYWLFPNPEVSPLGNPVKAGKTYRLPGTKGSCNGNGQWLGLDEEPGTEEVFLIASRWQAHDLEEALGKLSRFQKTSPKGTSPEPLLGELKERIAARDRDQRSARAGAYFSKVVTFEHRGLGRLVEKIR